MIKFIVLLLIFILQGCATTPSEPVLPDNTLIIDGERYYDKTVSDYQKVKQGRKGFWLWNKEAYSYDSERNK